MKLKILPYLLRLCSTYSSAIGKTHPELALAGSDSLISCLKFLYKGWLREPFVHHSDKNAAFFKSKPARVLNSLYDLHMSLVIKSLLAILVVAIVGLFGHYYNNGIVL